MIRVFIDENDYDILVRVLEIAGKNTRAGLKKAVNQTARYAKKSMHKKVLEEYVVHKKYFGSNQIEMTNATNSNLTARLRIVGRPIHLSEFKYLKNTKSDAAKAYVKKGNSYKGLETNGIKAFVAKMSNGKVVILRRKAKERYPVGTFYGPGLAQMAGQAYQKIEKEIQDKLHENINRMVEQIIGGKK